MHLDIKNLKEEKLIESQKWLMDKFVISNKQNITQNLDENITNEQEIYQKVLEDNEVIQLQDNNDVQFCNTTNLDNELQNNLEENENNDEKAMIEVVIIPIKITRISEIYFSRIILKGCFTFLSSISFYCLYG